MTSKRIAKRVAILCVFTVAAAFALAGGTAAATSPPVVMDLGTPGSADFVNDAGQVAGVDTHGTFSWTEAGGFVYIGTLDGSRSPSIQGFSESGQMIGDAYTPSGSYHAYSWTQAGGLVDLGTLVANYSAGRGVNDVGQVVGWSLGGTSHRAFLWTQAGGMVDLGALAGGSSDGMAVNNSGQVVGESMIQNSPLQYHAFSWTQAHGMVDLGTLGGSRSEAYAVNDLGQVAGESTTAAGPFHAFSWTQAHGIIDLGTLGGDDSHAARVNSSGQVIGYSTTASGETHAFSWTQAGGMVDLGTLGGPSSTASALNDAGQVVGYSTTATGDTHAFSWTQAGGMVDLGTLGGTKSAAFDVNNNGEVAGYAYIASGAQPQHATLWRVSVPVAPPGAPGSVSAVAGDGQATVSFSPSASNGAPISTYTVTAAPGGASASGAQSPITVTGLSNGTSYTFSVTATNMVGTGQASAVSNAVTPTAPASIGGGGGGGSSAVSITVSPKSQTVGVGSAALFTVVVRNDGGGYLYAAGVSDGLAPACNRTSSDIPDLSFWAPGVSESYTCSLAGVTAGFTNVAVVTATTAPGDKISASDSAQVTVQAPLTPPTVTQPTPVAVARPLIGRPVAVPARIVAGKVVLVRFKVTRSDTGSRLVKATMVCDPRVGGKLIKHAEQFKGGIASLRFTVPKTARGKLLKVHLTIKLGSQSATRLASFRIG